MAERVAGRVERRVEERMEARVEARVEARALPDVFRQGWSWYDEGRWEQARTSAYRRRREADGSGRQQRRRRGGSVLSMCKPGSGLDYANLGRGLTM